VSFFLVWRVYSLVLNTPYKKTAGRTGGT